MGSTLVATLAFQSRSALWNIRSGVVVRFRRRCHADRPMGSQSYLITELPGRSNEDQRPSSPRYPGTLGVALVGNSGSEWNRGANDRHFLKRSGSYSTPLDRIDASGIEARQRRPQKDLEAALGCYNSRPDTRRGGAEDRFVVHAGVPETKRNSLLGLVNGRGSRSSRNSIKVVVKG
jgi:hypothetical protein